MDISAGYEINKGTVYLVGSGPGDPGLLTVKGLACIRNAEVVVYDFLASPRLLKHAPKAAELIYVGKKGGDHTLSQEGINHLLVEKAKENKAVVRLKGGDPFIFGRGGEEIEELLKHDIPFEIIPGVTSAVAAPAYAGIPLTHRKAVSAVAFITGHEDPTKTESSINWEALAKGFGTLVFLMGVKNLPNIVSNLTGHGMDASIPVAAVRWGTTSKQRTVTGTLDTIVDNVRAAGLKAPAVIVVGDVVKFRDQMRWFEDRPLFGKTIVVTRAREQASDLVGRLSSLGARCIECPTIHIIPPADLKPLDDAVAAVGDYDWLVFTSVNGVKYFFNRLFHSGRDVRALHTIRTAAIGPATAAALSSYGLNTDIIPESFRAESVVEVFRDESMEGKKVLIPRAEQARPVLPRELAAMGALVNEVTAYRTESSRENAEEMMSLLKAGEVDMITFTSSSTVTNFDALLPGDSALKKELLENVVIACIGPITADTVREAGFDPGITAESFTIPGLCDTIVNYYRQRT